MDNDVSVSTFIHKWLPGYNDFRFTKIVNNTHLETVAELIDAESKQWNSELITFAFDLHVWSGEGSGDFLVRSAYRLLQKNSLSLSSNFIQPEVKKFYRNLWDLKLSSKLKI